MSDPDLILAGMENGRSPDPSVSVQEAFVRRIKSLARTAPLHELEFIVKRIAESRTQTPPSTPIGPPP